MEAGQIGRPARRFVVGNFPACNRLRRAAVAPWRGKGHSRASKIDTFETDFVHERGTLVVGSCPIGHGVHDFTGCVYHSGSNPNQPVQFGEAVGHVPQEHRNVVVGVGPRITPRARAEQHGAFEAIPIGPLQRLTEENQDGISDGSLLSHGTP